MRERKKGRSAHIEINEAVIDRMKHEKIIMDQMGSVLLILTCLFENKLELLDYADDDNKERRLQILYKQLQRRELLEPDEKALWRLTPRGNELITFVREQQGKKSKIEAEDLVPIAEIEMDRECAGWIEDYVNIFPIVSKGERPLRVHPDTCINKMNAFLKRYKYNKDVILAATRLYIEDQASSGSYEYTSRADNFISKFAEKHPDYSSPLAGWCKRYEDGDLPGNLGRIDTTILDMV